MSYSDLCAQNSRGRQRWKDRELKSLSSNNHIVDQIELRFIEGGAELLGKIRPLWEKLNDLHAEKSPHYAEVFAKSTFLQRKAELEHRQ